MKSVEHKATGPTFHELNWFLIITIVFAIIIPLMGNFLGWSEKKLFDQRQWILSWYYSICIVIGIITFFRYGASRLATDRYSFFMLIGIFIFIFSVVLGILDGRKVSPMSVMAPFFTVLIFHIFPRVKTSINLSIVAWMLIAFLLAPLLVLIFPELFKIPFKLNAFDSFRGFSSSRTDYGYLVGIAILILVSRPALVSLVFIPAMLFVLMLSGNRAALLSVAIASAYSMTASRYKGSSVIVWIGLFTACAYLLTIFLGEGYLERGVTLFQDSGDRLKILAASIDKVYANILFGSGAFYQNVYVSSIGRIVEPHNSDLQSILNFGLIATMFCNLVVAKTYFSFNAVGRSFLLYWLIFGLFHPGYDAFLFTPESFIPLLLAVHCGPLDIRHLRRGNSRETSVLRIPLRFHRYPDQGLRTVADTNC